MDLLKFLFITILLGSTALSAQEITFESIEHDGATREYLLYIPDMYDGSADVPLLFNFHGYTSSPEAQVLVSDMRPIADTANFILVYPRGTTYFGETHWNVGSWTSGSPADDVGFIDALIDSLNSDFSIDLQRVYACGLSNGGYFSFELACQLSDRIAAIASIAGAMTSETFNSCNPTHPTPVLTVHGTADATVFYDGGFPPGSLSMDDIQAYWTDYNNTVATPIETNVSDSDPNDGSTVVRFAYTEGENCSEVVHYRVINGGHDWPGTWGNMDIDCDPLIWDFVSRYTLDGLIDCESVDVPSFAQLTESITLYPNPAGNEIHIRGAFVKPTPYRILNARGERLRVGEVSPSHPVIDLNGMPKGVYFLRLEAATQRFVIGE